MRKIKQKSGFLVFQSPIILSIFRSVIGWNKHLHFDQFQVQDSRNYFPSAGSENLQYCEHARHFGD